MAAEEYSKLEGLAREMHTDTDNLKRQTLNNGYVGPGVSALSIGVRDLPEEPLSGRFVLVTLDLPCPLISFATIGSSTKASRPSRGASTAATQ